MPYYGTFHVKQLMKGNFQSKPIARGVFVLRINSHNAIGQCSAFFFILYILPGPF